MDNKAGIRKRRKATVAEVDGLLRADPDRTLWSACVEIAEKYLLSPFTVKDWCYRSEKSGSRR